MSERKEARQAESLLVVGERWQSTGKADAAVTYATCLSSRPEPGSAVSPQPVVRESADAAKPTYKARDAGAGGSPVFIRKSPFWKLT